jgi:hypothetical protein
MVSDKRSIFNVTDGGKKRGRVHFQSTDGRESGRGKST